MFEEDLVPVSAEQQDARSTVRQAVYVDLYGRKSYEWIPQQGTTGPSTPTIDAPLDAPALTHKGYIPPTPMTNDPRRPYGAVLDAPLA